MRTLQIDKHFFIVPSGWRDMDADQLVKIADLADKRLSNYEFRIALLRIILGITVVKKKEIVIDTVSYYYFRHGLTNEFLMSEIDIRFITSAFDFMFTKKVNAEGIDVYSLHFSEVRNPIPQVKTPIGTLYGPADALSNLLLSEYIYAETVLNNFLKTGNFYYAVCLFAILYRPEAEGIDTSSPSYTGDRRETFNDFLIVDRAKDLTGTNKGIISLVIMWYEACREFITHKWPEVFGEVTDTSENTDTFSGFMKMVNSLANNDVTRIDKVRQTYLYDVMFTLQSVVVQNRKLLELNKPKH